MYYQRTAEQTLKRLAKEFPCVVVYGPRQCGKSTLVQTLFFSQYEFVTLDDMDELSLALSNPKLFLDSHPFPVIIDEIQKAPLLLSEIKLRIDKQKFIWMKEDRPYELMYLLTGSNQFELQKGILESLAGRVGIMELNSFSLAEKKHRDGEVFVPDLNLLLKKEKENKDIVYTKNQIFDEIFQGGMPDFVTKRVKREDYFKSYIATYLEKDVRLLIENGSETTFRTFLSYLALRTAQEIKYDELSSAVGIDVKTVKRWLSILECSGIIFFLQPFMKNQSNRIIKTPKVYFADTGLCAYLCGWPNSDMLMKCAMDGAFYETYVISEIWKSFLFDGSNPKDTLFYYRDIDQKEVDLIYWKNQKITPIQIKKGINPSKPDKNFNVLKKYNYPIQKGLIVDTTDKIRPINENVYSLPVGLIE